MSMKNMKRHLPAAVFCLFITLMMVLFFVLPKQEYSINEKRKLRSLPTPTVESVLNGNFSDEFESYLSDNFQWRDFFVGTNAYYNLLSGRNGTSGLYKGKDGYIINTPIENNSESISRNVKKFNNFIERINKTADMMIVPSTGYIMNNKLPRNHLKYDDSAILADIDNRLSDKINFISLENTFKSAMNSEQLYYKTDHHWTTQGAYNAYLKYCDIKGLMPVARNSFYVKEYENFFGTAYSKSGLWLTKPDKVQVWSDKSGYDVNVEIDDGAEGKKKSKSLFFNEHLKNMDKYPVFLDGNHSFVKVTNNKLPGGKLLIIKDSFAHCMVPFLTNHYKEIYMVDLRYYKSAVSMLVQSENINDILILYGLDNIVNDTNIVWVK